MTDSSVIFNIIAKDQASGTFSKIGKAAGALFSGLAIGAGIAQLKGAIGAASDLAETQSKVNVLFGKGAGVIDKWSDSSATALGQSKQQALDAAATFAIFGKSAGLSGDNLAGFSTKLTGLATDMASFSNTSPAEAIEAIGAALRGENDPIEKYGVLLNDAAERTEALKLGLIKTTTQALTPQQRVLAVQSLLFKQTASSQGDFARTSGGLANQQRILAAQFTDVKTKLGGELLPIMLKFTSGLMAVIGFVQRNQSWLKPIAVGLGVMAGAIWLVTTAQTAWNIAMALNPIGLIVIAIIGLVAGIIYAWKHSEKFRDVVIGVWNGIKGAALAVWNWISGTLWPGIKAVWDGIAGAALWLWHSVLEPLFKFYKSAFDLAWQIISSFGHLWWDIWVVKVGGAVMWVWHTLLEPMVGAWKVIFGLLGDLFSWLWNDKIKPAWNLIKGGFQGGWDLVSGIFDKIMGKVHAVGDTVKGVFHAIGGFIGDGFSAGSAMAKGAMNGIIGLINKAVGFVNSNVVDYANKFPGVDFPHIPNIPQLYTGGVVTRGGRALVGEQGAEVVSLPTGAAVYPNGSDPGGGGGVVELRSAPADVVAEAILTMLRPHIRTRYAGDVTRALAGATGY